MAQNASVFLFTEKKVAEGATNQDSALPCFTLPVLVFDHLFFPLSQVVLSQKQGTQRTDREGRPPQATQTPTGTMASSSNRALAAVVTAFALAVTHVVEHAEAHPNCSGDFAPDLDVSSSFCPSDNVDGFCCNAAQEESIETNYNLAGVSGRCAEMYQEVCVTLYKSTNVFAFVVVMIRDKMEHNFKKKSRCVRFQSTLSQSLKKYRSTCGTAGLRPYHSDETPLSREHDPLLIIKALWLASVDHDRDVLCKVRISTCGMRAEQNFCGHPPAK